MLLEADAPKKEESLMAKRIAPLSDIQVKNAKAQEKEYKLYDGGGMFLLVTASGGRLWRFALPS